MEGISAEIPAIGVKTGGLGQGLSGDADPAARAPCHTGHGHPSSGAMVGRSRKDSEDFAWREGQSTPLRGQCQAFPLAMQRC